MKIAMLYQTIGMAVGGSEADVKTFLRSLKVD